MAVGITERWFSIIFLFKAAPQALVGTSCATAKINSCKTGIPRHLPETQCLATTEPCPVGLWFFPFILPLANRNHELLLNYHDLPIHLIFKNCQMQLMQLKSRGRNWSVSGTLLKLLSDATLRPSLDQNNPLPWAKPIVHRRHQCLLMGQDIRAV